MVQPLPVPSSLASLSPEAISARFRAHLERSIFRDQYATPEQQLLAGAITDDERRAFSMLIDETCALWNTSLSHAERESHVLARAPWLAASDWSRLHGAAAFMMR